MVKTAAKRTFDGQLELGRQLAEAEFMRQVAEQKIRGERMFQVSVVTVVVVVMMMMMMVLQEGSPTTYQVAACSPQNFDERLMIYTTLFKVCSIFSVRSSSYFYGFDNCNGLLTR